MNLEVRTNDEANVTYVCDGDATVAMFLRSMHVADVEEHVQSVLARRFWEAQAEWSRATFGADAERGPIGPLKHLEKEAREAQAEEDVERRKVEIVDCQFLVFDAARRAGMSFEEFFRMCFEKLAVNEKRTWNKPTTDGAVEHVRG